ncbi:cytidine deaminase [Synechococcus sp. RSCCF101]|uniref:cytidine deaminase n=1 Tax=Synechococcus sp. RSCCF101 TaxID=2511069 RepID=UPI0012453B75|nr:cytidine deaminase [Synechococcus sp. RSCCF101]QEY31278.1 cytidine deaminase [Synechococcus sp. RSCCF101]
MVDPLIEAARAAARRAHCPYSHFAVGAAVRCRDGTVLPGCNVENASYGLCLCAERVALSAAVAAGREPVELAVCCASAGADAPAGSRMPCGACRQVMAELMPPESRVHVDGVGVFRVSDLMPEPFRLN